MTYTQVHIYLFLLCFSFSGQERSVKKKGQGGMVQKWSPVAAPGNLTSHQDTKACYRVETRNQKCSPHDGLC